MNKKQDFDAAETAQTTSEPAVASVAICSPVRSDVFGWFGNGAQTEPEHDPGFDAPCPICGYPVGRHSVDSPVKTISLMVEDPAKRRNSFFFRAHKRCWEMVSDHERNMVESSLIDHIVDADKMVAPEHHFPDAAQMVGERRPTEEGFWWRFTPGRKWEVGTAVFFDWGDGDEVERVLCFTTGGCFRRCDTSNVADKGVRYFPAIPPFPPNI